MIASLISVVNIFTAAIAARRGGELVTYPLVLRRLFWRLLNREMSGRIGGLWQDATP